MHDRHAARTPETVDLRPELARVVRHFQRYTAEQRASRAASHRLGARQRGAVGEYFYTHPAVPNVSFPTRRQAARAGHEAHRSPEARDGG